MKLKKKIKQKLKKKAQIRRYPPAKILPQLLSKDKTPLYAGKDPVKKLIEILSAPKIRKEYFRYIDKNQPFVYVSLPQLYERFGISRKELENRLRNLPKDLLVSSSKLDRKVPIVLTTKIPARGRYYPNYNVAYINISQGDLLTAFHELYHSLQRPPREFLGFDLTSKRLKNIRKAVPWNKISKQYMEILRRKGLQHKSDLEYLNRFARRMQRPEEFFNYIAALIRKFVIDNKRFPKDHEELKNYVVKNFHNLGLNRYYIALVFLNLYHSKNKEVRKLFRHIVNSLVMNDRQKLEKIRRIA